MSGLVDTYIELWREAVNAPSLRVRYTARLAILALHILVVVLLDVMFMLADRLR